MITDIDYKLLEELYPNNLKEILDKIEAGYPVQYAIGYVDFYGYKINVDERVLIPRFETEGLVEETIKQIKLSHLEPKILEVGTGSGCIAIALSKELNTKVTAIDISKDVIEVASSNAALNQAEITFKLEDIHTGEIEDKYNVLISNPPYVSRDEEVDPRTKYEPQNAIFAEDNGLEFYKVILQRSKEFLEPNNLIAFEIGCTQAISIREFAKTIYPNAFIQIKQDLSGRDRYILIRNE